MGQKRRTFLKAGGVTAGSIGLAGCLGVFGSGDSSTDDESDPTPQESTDTPKNENSDTESSGSESTDSESDDGGDSASVPKPVELGPATEWNAMRARVWDAYALGRGGHMGAGATVAGSIFERFEKASGKHNAHETLEETSKSSYEEFEEALGELRTKGLEAENIERTREEAVLADKQLRAAQTKLAGSKATETLDLQLLGLSLQNAAALAVAGEFEAAARVAGHTKSRFEKAAVHETIENADSEAYESFEGAIEQLVKAAENKDLDGVRTAASDGFAATTQGAYAIAPAKRVAHAGQLAAYQARGWDAKALAQLGGPSTEFAHAAALNIYRARAYDATRLYELGESEAATRFVEETFAHFEGARAHEALEKASEKAYKMFEHEGLESLGKAIKNDDKQAVTAALKAVDSGLRTGISALAGEMEAALLEAGFFRARIGDAVEQYNRGNATVAGNIASGLFKRFEANELGFHEAVEETDKSLYEKFEETHLKGIIAAFKNGNDAAVKTHAAGIHETLLSFETAAGSRAQASAVESGYMAARLFDADALAVTGRTERAKTVIADAFEQFEANAGGFHEALETANKSRYESFESALGSAKTAVTSGKPAPAVSTFNKQAVGAIYDIVSSAGGSLSGKASTVMKDTFAHFEQARVHEALEQSDHESYEGFEKALQSYIGALESGSGISSAAGSFANATLKAQFALAGAPDAAPVDTTSKESGHGSKLKGGPNVVSGVPKDADHVVDMKAVAFEPAELTIKKGDTVAWKHAGGEAHSVTAVGDEIPEDAEYWASGGFDSEQKARTGWENGKGAVKSGQSYVHTFETKGEHNYLCIPHEAAGMVGKVIVE